MAALEAKQPHIPFRDSKLTHVLQPAFLSHSQVVMFVHISPSETDASESSNSLFFGSKVRRIELGPAQKNIISDSHRVRAFLSPSFSHLEFHLF